MQLTPTSLGISSVDPTMRITITNETFDVPRQTIPLKVRSSARAVIINDRREVCLMHSTVANFYKLPGGGIDPGETIHEALIREVREETGYEVIHSQPLGVVEEYREYNPADGLHHISHGYLVQVGSQGAHALTEEEALAGFQLVRVPLDEGLALIQDNPRRIADTADDLIGVRFMTAREEAFVKEAMKY